MECAGCDAVVLYEIDWVVSRDTVLRPDLLIVCGGEPERHVVRTPALVAEVLSGATRERDVKYKREIYTQRRVPNYLIVDPDAHSVASVTCDQDGMVDERPLEGHAVQTICNGCRIEWNVQRIFSRRDGSPSGPSAEPR